jgi:hypothetical protein
MSSFMVAVCGTVVLMNVVRAALPTLDRQSVVDQSRAIICREVKGMSQTNLVYYRTFYADERSMREMDGLSHVLGDVSRSPQHFPQNEVLDISFVDKQSIVIVDNPGQLDIRCDVITVHATKTDGEMSVKITSGKVRFTMDRQTGSIRSTTSGGSSGVLWIGSGGLKW